MKTALGKMTLAVWLGLPARWRARHDDFGGPSLGVGTGQ